MKNGYIKKRIQALCGAGLLMLLAAPVVAQTVLTSKDGMLSVEGTLTKVDAQSFYLEGDFGLLVLDRDMLDCAGEGCPIELSDDQIILTSPDGSLRLVGTLVELTDTDYVLATDSGELSVRRELVVCEGSACPNSQQTEEVDRSVVLTAVGGGFSLEGELLDFADNTYLLGTPNGELFIRRELVTCEGEACPKLGAEVTIDSLTVAGPDDVGLGLLRAIANRYADDKSQFVTSSSLSANSADLILGDDKGNEVGRITAIEMDAASSIQAVIAGDVQFALVRERATPQQLSAILGRQIENVEDVLFERTIALDALSVVAHPSNPLDTLSISNVADILSGRITDWSQIGGPTGPINIYGLERESELMVQVREAVLGSASARMTTYEQVATGEGLAEAIANDVFGLAVLYRSQQGDLPVMDLASVCNVYYGSSDFSVQTQEYPYVIGWYLYARADLEQSELANNLIAFLQTDDGQETLSSLGLLSQSLRLQPMKNQGARVLTSVLTAPGSEGRQMVSTYFDNVAESRRLSTALRFRTGSTRPDSKALEDIRRISAIIRSPEYENYEVKLVGFSDSVGAFGSNVALSNGRAATIAELLINENPGWLSFDNVNIMGVGPIAPVACNDQAAGRELNRRVEVWLAPPEAR